MNDDNGKIENIFIDTLKGQTNQSGDREKASFDGISELDPVNQGNQGGNDQGGDSSGDNSTETDSGNNSD